MAAEADNAFLNGNRGAITACAIVATLMQALDTTIANVALPYMQGSVSASQDQIDWVLTSYIVAAAIMTPPTGFLAGRFLPRRAFAVSTVLLGSLIIYLLAASSAGWPAGPPVLARISGWVSACSLPFTFET